MRYLEHREKIVPYLSMGLKYTLINTYTTFYTLNLKYFYNSSIATSTSLSAYSWLWIPFSSINYFFTITVKDWFSNSSGKQLESNKLPYILLPHPEGIKNPKLFSNFDINYPLLFQEVFFYWNLDSQNLNRLFETDWTTLLFLASPLNSILFVMHF